MQKQYKISIPSPCHENWAAMTPAEKGRFCGSCQKVVHDFRRSSDREIRDVYLKEANTCGHFTKSQLNRDLVVSSKPNTVWVAAGAAILGFLTVGNNVVHSQNTFISERSYKPYTTPTHQITSDTIAVRGKIVDDIDMEVPGVIIRNEHLDIEVMTDSLGSFSIEANYGDTISYSFVGYNSGSFVADIVPVNIKLDYDLAILETMTFDVYGRPGLQRPTFFGRIFYRIGNLFR